MEKRHRRPPQIIIDIRTISGRPKGTSTYRFFTVTLRTRPGFSPERCPKRIYANTFRPVGINQRLIEMVIIYFQITLRFNMRIIVRAGAPQQYGAAFQVKRHARLQLQASRQIASGREIRLPSPCAWSSSITLCKHSVFNVFPSPTAPCRSTSYSIAVAVFMLKSQQHKATIKRSLFMAHKFSLRKNTNSY